jgi:hypothetical protein
MITLDQIVSSNLQMLKSQEAELLKALGFVQKAKQLFTSGGDAVGSSVAPKGRNRSKASRRTAAAAPKKSIAVVVAKPAKTSKPVKSSGGPGKETRLSKIISAMKQKKAPIASGELIETLFKQQKEDRNFPHFRQLVYTTLTQAFKRGIIKRKGDKIHLA